MEQEQLIQCPAEFQVCLIYIFVFSLFFFQLIHESRKIRENYSSNANNIDTVFNTLETFTKELFIFHTLHYFF